MSSRVPDYFYDPVTKVYIIRSDPVDIPGGRKADAEDIIDLASSEDEEDLDELISHEDKYSRLLRAIKHECGLGCFRAARTTADVARGWTSPGEHAAAHALINQLEKEHIRLPHTLQ